MIPLDLITREELLSEYTEMMSMYEDSNEETIAVYQPEYEEESLDVCN